jgi:hypothetical protein
MLDGEKDKDKGKGSQENLQRDANKDRSGQMEKGKPKQSWK